MARTTVRRATRAFNQGKSALRAGLATAKTMQAGTALALAAGNAIAQRGALAGGRDASSPRAQAEIARMLPEKLMAGTQAGFAMLPQMFVFNRLMMNFWMSQMMRGMALSSALLASRSPVTSAAAVMRSAEDVLAQSMTTGMSGIRSAQSMAQAGAKPVQRVASSNAKRLARDAVRAA